MSFLTRDNLIKLFAALLILGFLVELLIVYTYAPQGPQQAAGTTASSQVEEGFVGSSVPFVVRSFTGSMFFQCNATSDAFPSFSELLGVPIAVGATPLGKLYLARVANVSVLLSNESFLADFRQQLSPVCGRFVVYREASVVFNGTSVELQSLVNPLNRTTLSKRDFDAYTDRFGRGAVALVADESAVPGSVVEFNLRATLIGSQILPGSLLLEEQAVPRARPVEFSSSVSVNSFTGKQIAVVEIPWENRTVKPVVFGESLVVVDQFNPVDEVVVNGVVDQSVFDNLSFVRGVEAPSENVTALNVGNFTDKAAVLSQLAAVNVSGELVAFPVSSYVAELNSSEVVPVSAAYASASVLREGLVVPVGVGGEFALPAEFLALVFSNVTLNQVVEVRIQGIAEDGSVSEIYARQIG